MNPEQSQQRCEHTQSLQRKAMSINQVAEYLQVSRDTVELWIHSKKLTAYKVGQWRIFEDDLAHFIEQGRNK